MWYCVGVVNGIGTQRASQFKKMYEYNDTFYKHINNGATRSAEVILPHTKKLFTINSVIDFGCGQGAWLEVWRKLGVQVVCGVDGDYVNRNSLLIDKDDFYPCDLRQTIDMGRQFDLVQSLEVAEHIPEQVSDCFIDNLVAHGKVILFSSAVKGQGGEDHINEQPYEYWRDKFLTRGYILVDSIRPAVKGNCDVEPWYRYNTFIFIDQEIINNSIKDIAHYHRYEKGSIPDISPFLYKMRKQLFLLFPVSVISWLAMAKKTLFVNIMKLTG